MPKEKTICFFCHLPVNKEAVYYTIKGPDGTKVAVHGHVGVGEHGGTRMLKGKPFPKENN